MGFVVDSSILISAARGRFSLKQLGSDYADTPFVIASITVSELLHGVYRTADLRLQEKRRAFAELVIDLFPVIAFDQEIARTHAHLWARLASIGQMIGAHDLLIAATAITLGYGVLTTNEREFQRLTELTVVNPLR
jgi:tRNA(fMet)-specific endonuclease VapC